MTKTMNDVLYALVLLREQAIKNLPNLEFFSISINDLSVYLDSDYKNIHKHIKKLDEKKLILKKLNGYLPYVGKNYVNIITQIYKEAQKIKINPNNLLNKSV